jgi:hypothetical protein
VKLQVFELLPREEVVVVELFRLSTSITLYVWDVSLMVPLMVVGLSVDPMYDKLLNVVDNTETDAVLEARGVEYWVSFEA